MEAVEPPTVEPVSEKTLAIKQGLQDVTKELREIRRLLEAEHQQKESRWTAFKRAISQLLSQL